MLRRLSTFRRDSKEKKKTANGETNGITNGAQKEEKASPTKRMSFFTKEEKVDPPDHSGKTDDVSGIFEKYAQVIHASQRPLPLQASDGTYIEKDAPSGIFAELRSLGFKDAKTLKEVIANKASGDYQDDKTYLMERVIQLVSSLPANSKHRVDLTNDFINELWCSLQHPPISYLGNQFKYRQADGSCNNIMFPHLGAANTPYARSVLPMTVQPGALPDPGVIFDSVYARNKYRKHPNNVSSVLFYWASLIIHDLFQTDHSDVNNSKTSSYLDLSPLYGDVQDEQNMMRTFKDGKIKPDCFSEQRLLGFPPGCGVLLIMFNRFHNYVVEQLALINENGRFSKPREGLSEEATVAGWKKYDEDLFQVGRLVTCGLYMNITLLDYLRTIVNLNRSNTTWTLDPRVNMDQSKIFGKDGTPRGVGNQVSAEFNLVYRWHSCTSAKDEAWTENLYQEMFGKPAAEVPMHELLMGLAKWDHSMDKDPHKRPFAKMERQADGNFKDDDLVKILCDSIEDTAGAFGANNVPKALRAVEILGMQQARQWGLGTLNEFRKFFGLKPHDTFESINSDPEVANHLKHLYAHPDFVEMYPGIVAEEAKVPMVPGVGIAPTFTISRAILSDAVCLVRGDRFYTTDYHAKNLTNWGFNEVAYDFNIEQGCVFYKLFLRSFPNHFEPNSIYAHMPMTIPSENQKIMRSLGREGHYLYTRPVPIAPKIILTSYASKVMLERQSDFKVVWGKTTTELLGKAGADFMLSGDTKFHSQQRKTMATALYRKGWRQEVKAFYENITLKLLHEKSFKLAGRNYVDITRDVGNLAHVHFAANVFSLPLKTAEHPRGVFSEQELYMAAAIIFVCIFFDYEPTKSFPLHFVARELAQKLGAIVEINVKAVNASGFIAGIVDALQQNKSQLTDYGVHMVRRLLESGLGPEEITWSQILPTAIAMIPNQAQVFTQALDYYLSPAGVQHLPEIRRLARLDTDAAEDTLLHYAMEGVRLNGTFGSFREASVATTLDDGPGKKINIKPGDRVFMSFVGANRDPAGFPDPEQVKLDRPLDSYIHYGVGPHACLGADISQVALTAMFKTVFKLENLKAAPGAKGVLKKIPRPGGYYMYLREDYGTYFPFPLSWQVTWDGELPAIVR